MSSTVLYMSMSLDGFVAGPNESVDNGLGDGGERLHEWILAGDPTEHGGAPALPRGVNGEVMEEALRTGAVVAGRGTFEPARGWGGDHHDGVPIFILSREKSGPDPQWPLVTYLDDVETAMASAKEAAGDKDVLVHDATVALDEIQIHLIPVLIGEGRRLFEHLGSEHIELEPIRVAEGNGVTHLRYRVLR
jgi:dihydrofolate reductase